jgi:membrane protease YdiL (CAAX protease family)
VKTTWTITILAAILFVPLFVTRGISWLDFWWWLTANLAFLLLLVALLDRDWRKEILGDVKAGLPYKIGLGLLSAGVLFGLFYAGNIFSRKFLPFAGTGIADIYGFKAQASPLRVALLMVLVIGPGEELFWRGFLQRRVQQEQGPWKGFAIATSVYALIHIGSGNLMLILAAGLCGLCWGFLYLRARSLLTNMVSHTVWDISIFLLFPLS